MKPIYTQLLQSGYTYHIFNQGNNGENLFKEERNYYYFLQKYQEYIAPMVYTYAWCLLPNHFHVLIQFKDYNALHEFLPKRFLPPPVSILSKEDMDTSEYAAYNATICRELSRQFANFFGGYTRAINNAYSRRDKLFSLPFKRIQVNDERYFEWLLCYIHRNPIHHGFCSSFEEWEFSSYKEIANAIGNTVHSISNLCETDFLQSWFGSYDRFLEAHQQSLDGLNKNYLLE